MCDKINDHAKCEIRSVIRFLNTKNVRLIEIYRQIIDVYGNVLNENSVRKWCIIFNGGWTNIHDEERSGRTSVVTDEHESRNSNQGLRKTFNNIDVSLKTGLCIEGLCSFFPEFSRKFLYEIVCGYLGYIKVYSRQILTDESKKRLKRLALTFLSWYNKACEKFFNTHSYW